MLGSSGVPEYQDHPNHGVVYGEGNSDQPFTAWRTMAPSGCMARAIPSGSGIHCRRRLQHDGLGLIPVIRDQSLHLIAHNIGWRMVPQVSRR